MPEGYWEAAVYWYMEFPSDFTGQPGMTIPDEVFDYLLEEGL